jgi:hypothetical protein
MSNVFLASTVPFVARMSAPNGALGAGDLCLS